MIAPPDKPAGAGSIGIRRAAGTAIIHLLDQQPPLSDFNLQVAADHEASLTG
jgi:hypothetical protein